MLKCASILLSLLVTALLKRDIGGIKLPVADPVPRTMRATKYRMRIPASKESAIRGKREKVLSDTSRATGCDDPRPN